jgi:hypothetical protein
VKFGQGDWYERYVLVAGEVASRGVGLEAVDAGLVSMRRVQSWQMP